MRIAIVDDIASERETLKKRTRLWDLTPCFFENLI